MRHGKKFNHLGRKTAHRKAMLANMACSLIEHKRINTTVAKAKALRQFVEPLITKSKPENNVTAEKGTHNRRIVFKNLRDKYAVTELFGTVAEKVGDRPGGYTRIIKLGNRLGDNADMAMIELVDFNEIYNAGKPKKKSTRRSRRGGSQKEDGKAVDNVEETKVTDSPDKNKAAENIVETKAETKPAEAPEAGSTPEVKEPENKKSEVEESETKEAPEKEPENKKSEVEESETKEAPEKEAKSEETTEAKADDKPKAEPESKSESKDEEAESKKDDTKE